MSSRNHKTTIVATPKAINGRTKVLLDKGREAAESPTLAHAIDLAKDGTAIGKARGHMRQGDEPFSSQRSLDRLGKSRTRHARRWTNGLRLCTRLKPSRMGLGQSFRTPKIRSTSPDPR